MYIRIYIYICMQKLLVLLRTMRYYSPRRLSLQYTTCIYTYDALASDRNEGTLDPQIESINSIPERWRGHLGPAHKGLTHKGPAHKGPGKPTRAPPIRA